MTLIRDNLTWKIQLFFPRNIFWMQLWSFRQDPANYINLRLQIFSTHSTRRPIWTHNTLGWTNKEIWSTTFLLYFTSSQVIYLYFYYIYWFRAFPFMLLSLCFSLAFLLIHPLLWSLIWFEWRETKLGTKILSHGKDQVFTVSMAIAGIAGSRITVTEEFRKDLYKRKTKSSIAP